MKDWILPICFLTAGLFLWHAAVSWFGIPEFLLPTPRGVVTEWLSRPSFYLSHAEATLMTALTGFTVAVLFSIGLAALFSWSRTLERGLYPYVLAFKITPAVALTPLLVLWLGIGLTSKIAITVLICFFPVFVGAQKGFRSVDQDLLDLFRSMKATKWQTLIHLRLPYALPYLFPGLKVSLLLSLTGAVVGEYIAANKGIGYLALYALRTYDSPVIFAAIFTLVGCGFILFGFLSLLERKVVFWQSHDGL